MPKKIKIGKAEIEMRSFEGGKCIFFGKKRCKVIGEQKKLPKEERCAGFNTECPEYVGASPFVPAFDDKFLLPERESEILTLALEANSNVLLVGKPGTGKTSLAKQVAPILNWPLIQFSCSEETTSSKILGQWVVTEGRMEWADGYVTSAMRNGYILLEDEADFMRPELRGEVHSVMEDKGTLTLSSLHPKTKKPYQEVITKHPNFRWISSANTTGHGDDSFNYHGTQYFNAAARDRYDLIIDFRHKDPVEEELILTEKTGINENTAEKMIQVANLCRGTEGNEVLFQFSLRRLLSWAKYWNKLGPELSSSLAILNFCSEQDKHFIKSLLRSHMNIEIR